MYKSNSLHKIDWQMRILDMLAVWFLLSEILKQLLLTYSNSGHYQWWYFPFQLCSMPLYLLPLRQILVHRQPPAQTRAAAVIPILSDFLADFCLLGGIFVFFDQSGMHYALPILTLHSYLWHLSMIFLGLYLILTGAHSACGCAETIKKRGHSAAFSAYIRLVLTRSLRSYLPAAGLFCILAAAAEGINAAFHTFGSINMFYISPWEPVTQVVFKGIAARIGTPAEIMFYLFMLLFGGFVFHLFAVCLSILRMSRRRHRSELRRQCQ